MGYLKVLINEYLQFKKHIFPVHCLRPKHHYFSHYPDLIIHFGPLIRLWTLWFESKHVYFKQCVRKLHNFKNLCFTLAERHQLLQAFLHTGEFFPPSIVADKATEFVVSDYNDVIRESVAGYDFQPENTTVAHEATVKGTTYKKNMYSMLLFRKLMKALLWEGNMVPTLVLIRMIFWIIIHCPSTQSLIRL